VFEARGGMGGFKNRAVALMKVSHF
jgi:hypothetical protein